MNKKYKIAVVAACPFPYPRGTPIRIMRMAEGLVARGHEVHVITYHLGTEIEELPFKIHRIPFVSTYRKLSPGPTYQKIAILDSLLAIKLFQILRSAEFDIIHAHHYEGLLASIPAARFYKIPLVFDIHTLLKSELPHYPLGLPLTVLQKIGTFFDTILPKQADHIVSVTNLIRDRLINEIRIDSQKVTTIYGGIEANHFASHNLTLPDSASPALIYTGNLAPYQGIDLMLHAFRKIVDRYPNIILKLITNSSISSYLDLIQTLRLKNNLVIEDANYFQIPTHLHLSTVALHPRVHSDGLPLKLLNYMATGRPIVSFAGSAEVLKHEQTGLVIENDNVDAFANAVLRLLENPAFAEDLGKNAQAYVQEFFVWENSIQMLETIYDSLVK
jgi:glycosyltransferase involved in cell wall biosynthesis